MEDEGGRPRGGDSLCQSGAAHPAPPSPQDKKNPQ